MKQPMRLLIFIAFIAELCVFLNYTKNRNQTFDTDYIDTSKYALEAGTLDTIIAGNITSSMSDYDKIKAIHDYIVSTAEYDYENVEKDTIPDIDYTAKGILENHIGVCMGYSEAFQLLMDELDIECYTVSGIANNEKHSWNVVNIDGEYYHVDCTFDDPITSFDDINTSDSSDTSDISDTSDSSDTSDISNTSDFSSDSGNPDNSNNFENSDNSDKIRYTYFLVNDEQIMLTHNPESDYPACTSDKYMYMEKIKNVPYFILESSADIASTVVYAYDSLNSSSVTCYFPDYIEGSESEVAKNISSELSVLNMMYGISTYTYTPFQKCGMYYYTTITLE